MVDVFVVLASIATIILLLPALGINIRIFNREKSMTVEQGLSRPAIPKWRWWLTFGIACMAIILSVFDLYLTNHNALPTKKEWAEANRHLELIQLKNFANEIVSVDGKSFVDCTFQNVTFVYEGKLPFLIDHNIVMGPTKFKVAQGPAYTAASMVQGVVQDLCKSKQITCPEGRPVVDLQPLEE